MRRALGLDRGGAQGVPVGNAGSSRQVAVGGAAPGRPGQRSDAAKAISLQTSTAFPLRQRVAELERQLAAERQRHEEARQLLQQARLTVTALDARFQHAVTAQQDELDTERQFTIEAQRELDDGLFETQERTRRPAAAGGRAAASDTAESPAAAVEAASSGNSRVSLASSVEQPVQPKRRGRPRIHPAPEPKPVRWWTPSYRGKAKG